MQIGIHICKYIYIYKYTHTLVLHEMSPHLLVWMPLNLVQETTFGDPSWGHNLTLDNSLPVKQVAFSPASAALVV